MDEYRREMLLKGLDEIGKTLRKSPRIAAFERRARRWRRAQGVPATSSQVLPETELAGSQGRSGAGPPRGGRPARLRPGHHEHAIGAAGVVAEAGTASGGHRRRGHQAEAVPPRAVGHPSLAAAEGRRARKPACWRSGSCWRLRQSAAGGVHPALRHASPLRPDRLEGWICLSLREPARGPVLWGAAGARAGTAVNTMRYFFLGPEIERVARVAFQAAQGRRRSVTSGTRPTCSSVAALAGDGDTDLGGVPA